MLTYLYNIKTQRKNFLNFSEPLGVIPWLIKSQILGNFEVQSPFVSYTQCMRLGVVISMCLNMYLPLEMESSRNSILGNVSNPDGGSEVSPVANIKTSSTDTAAWSSAKKRHFHLGNVFSQLVMKNMSDLQTFIVKEIVCPVAQSLTFFKSPVTPWWTEVRFEESLKFKSS